MSIYKWCAKCKIAYALEKAGCTKCGTIYTKNEQKYRANVMVNGRQITKVVPNLTLAREIDSATRTDAIRDEFNISRADVKFHVIWEKYYQIKANLPKVKSHKYYYEKLFCRWANRELRSIEPEEVQRLILELRTTKTQNGHYYSEAAIKGIIVFLSAIFNYAKKTLRLKFDNPCEYVEKPREVVRPYIPLTPQQRIALIDSLNKYENVHVANLIRFILCTGTRRSEVLQMKWIDIDIAGKRLLIPKTKSRREESIPLSETCMAILDYQAIHRDPNNEYVFPSPITGLPYVNIRHAWGTIKKEAGIQALGIHKLRHQFATDLINQDVNIYVVGQLLRHSSPEMTQRYAHLYDATLRNAIKKIE